SLFVLAGKGRLASLGNSLVLAVLRSRGRSSRAAPPRPICGARPSIRNFDFGGGYGNHAAGLLAAPNIPAGVGQRGCAPAPPAPGAGRLGHVVQRGGKHRPAEPERQLPGRAEPGVAGRWDGVLLMTSAKLRVAPKSSCRYSMRPL